MAEIEEDSRVCLDISSRETIPSLICRLNVPNFFTHPEYDGAVFKSPTFQYADATWFFEFQSESVVLWQRKNKDAEQENDYRIFRVNLVRLNSVIRQEIFGSMALLDENDKEYDYQSFATDIKEDENKDWIAYFYAILSRFVPKFFKEDKNKLELGCFYYSDYPSFNRRETLCLIIQFFCEKSTVSDEDEIENTTNGDLETKTEKEEKYCSVTLGLSTRENISSVVCTLKIPNFFIFSEYDGTTFESPTFLFANASWCFRFSSPERCKSCKVRDKRINFDAHMVRLDSEIPEQLIFFTIALLDKNDQEYQKDRWYTHFLEDNTGNELFEECNECWMWCFDNEESCFDRRDSLTLIIRLFYDKSTEKEVYQLQNTTQRDIATSTVDDFDTDEKDEKDNESEFEGIESLVQNMKSLLVNGQGSNAMLKVEDYKFIIHKVILMARSPVFASMFQHDMKENATCIVDIPDCSAAAFEVFLSYLYTGSVDDLTYNNLFDVYHAADKYQVDDLKLECAEFMENNLSVDNFCEVMTQSLQHIETDLQEKAIKFFCDNVKKIIRTVQWQKYMRDYPTQANELYIKAVDA